MNLPELLIYCLVIGRGLWMVLGMLVKAKVIKLTGRPKIDAVLLKAESWTWNGWQDTYRWFLLAAVVIVLCAVLAFVGFVIAEIQESAS